MADRRRLDKYPSTMQSEGRFDPFADESIYAYHVAVWSAKRYDGSEVCVFQFFDGPRIEWALVECNTEALLRAVYAELFRMSTIENLRQLRAAGSLGE